MRTKLEEKAACFGLGVLCNFLYCSERRVFTRKYFMSAVAFYWKHLRLRISFFSPVQWNWSGTLGMQMSVGWLVGLSVGWLVGWSVRNARTFLPINHEWMIGFWWYLHIWLVLMRCWSWPKVKVTRSKVKVKSTILWKIDKISTGR